MGDQSPPQNLLFSECSVFLFKSNENHDYIFLFSVAIFLNTKLLPSFYVLWETDKIVDTEAILEYRLYS
jgi:hypothetical protein